MNISINKQPDPKVPEDEYPFLLEVAPLLLTIALLVIQFSVFDSIEPHIPLVCGIVITGIFIRIRGLKWLDMESHFYKIIKIGLPALMILMGVGMLISAWIVGGTVPTIIYYGLGLFSPSTFLFSVCLICAIISLATGTSWGTVGTVGLAMMGIGEGLGIPAAMTGGALVSGAFFGDKMSPLSDTTNLTAAVCEIDLWRHIRGMMPTTVPAMLIALGLYAWIGSSYGSDVSNIDTVAAIQENLAAHYQLSIITLLPALVVIAGAVMRLPALPTIYSGIIAGCLVAMFLQGAEVKELFNWLQNGVKSNTGLESVDKLLSKGGMQSMTWVVTLTICALGFVGSLEYYGTLQAILSKISLWVKGRISLVGTSYAGIVGLGVLIGDVYTTLVLPGRLMKDKYVELGYRRTTLSRAIEDCGTLLSPLIPWNMGGAYVAATIGIATFTYAPYAFVCWLAPCFGMLWAVTGFFIPRRQPPNEPEDIEPPKEWEGL
ncbi:MAG: Na+/H+ antiporter NhaC [Gammaproteobacteria bacterium]|nr:MAG: Na+/H+ antiporter NhaC [Gammaproteobacteria bacterium]